MKHRPYILPEYHGPFDIIGDVHGCCDELEQLLKKLNYQIVSCTPGLHLSSGPVYKNPQGRKAIFLGDFVDRGPRILDTVRLIHNMVKADSALCVIGNHDEKLLRKLKGRNVQIRHGLENTMFEIDNLPGTTKNPFKEEVQAFLTSLLHYYILDNGQLVVSHAGIKEEMQGHFSEKIKNFTLYGEVTGKRDEYDLPIRGDWAAHYQGKAMVIYGHTPILTPQWRNNTLNIDTGCVMGGKLTALRYPEGELVSVSASKIYCESPQTLFRGFYSV